MPVYERLSTRSAILQWLLMQKWAVEYEIWRLKHLHDESLVEKKYEGKDRLMVIIELGERLIVLGNAISIARSSVRSVQIEISSNGINRSHNVNQKLAEDSRVI